MDSETEQKRDAWVAADLAKPLPNPLAEIGASVGNRRKAAESRYFAELGRLSATEYVVNASWPVPEVDDEDPGAVSCGCPFQGQSHVHADVRFTDLSSARLAFSRTKYELAARIPASLAPSRRVGA